MEAIKLQNDEFKNPEVVEALNFLNDLGKKCFVKFSMQEAFNQKQLIALANHIKQFRVENGILIYPDKGLFLVATSEKFLQPIFRLISFYVLRLIKKNWEHVVKAVENPDQRKPTQYFCSTRQIVAQLVNKNPYEVLTPYIKGRQILYISEFSKEELAKLPNYNEIDAMDYIIHERYLIHKYFGESIMYLSFEKPKKNDDQNAHLKVSEVVIRTLSDRYDEKLVDTLFELCDFIIFNDSFEIEFDTLQPQL